MRTLVIAAILALMVPVVASAQTPYAQNFENLAMVDGQLAGDGWLIFGNVFDPSFNYLYGYGTFPAPNNIGNWCDIVAGEGGAAQGAQQLVMYSDYANSDQGAGNWVESNLFQEQTVGAGATGTWYFTFDAKMGNLGGNSTALAFIKTLDPNAGWAMTNFITADMTTTPATWTGYVLSIDVTGLDGQIIQFGFSTTVTNYDPSGVFYDNVTWSMDEPVPTKELSWGRVKTLY